MKNRNASDNRPSNRICVNEMIRRNPQLLKPKPVPQTRAQAAQALQPCEGPGEEEESMSQSLSLRREGASKDWQYW